MADSVLVFVPAYNCQDQIGRVLDQLRGPVAELVDAVVVIDNGSRDATRTVARQALASLPIPGRLLGNRENVNLGGSHKVALREAFAGGFDHLIVLHGDDQADIRDFTGVLASGLHRRVDFVMGSRFSRGSRRIGYHWARTLFNILFNLLFSLVGRRCLADLGSGLNCFRVDWFRRWGGWQRFADDLTFNYHLILAIARSKVSCRFYPISWREEDQVSNAKLLKHGLRTLTIARHCVNSPTSFSRQRHTPRRWDAYRADVLFDNGQRWPTT